MDHDDRERALAVTTRWWDALWRNGDLEEIRQIYTDPFVRHSGIGNQVLGHDEYIAMVADFQRTLCRPVTTIDDRVFHGDRVWTRATSRGLNRETGDTTVVTWMLIQRIADGRIAEQWVLTARDTDWAV